MCSTRKRHSKIILSPKILNLSSYSLSKNQKNILIKGLKYTTTPKRNIIELKRDVVEFTRKLRLIEIFSSEEKEIKNEVHISLVKAKSSFHLPPNRNACLDKTTDFLQKQTFETSCSNKSSLTKAEWKDLLALKNNSELIIKEADKGGCVVLMNKPYYKRIIFQHLNDANTYQKTDEK